MSNLQPKLCPITGNTESNLVFSYSAPPLDEIGFARPSNEPYRREVWQFYPGGHFLSKHLMQVATGYDGAYLDATYKNLETLVATFERIIGLKPEQSDNVGRFSSVRDFSENWFGCERVPNLLDVGSGLGVFPYAVRNAGWECTAIDPDFRAVSHLNERVGVNGICGDFTELKATGRFDIVTINKVLEHVADPIDMLAKVLDWISPGGFVYIEVPDGEIASMHGSNREEFFIEHLHIFSLTSTSILARKAGFTVQSIIRLCEPSGKYTLRAFLSPMDRELKE